MRITIASVGGRQRSKDAYERLVADYLERCHSVARCFSESFRTEELLLDWIDRQDARTKPVALFLDSRGQQNTSRDFARWLGSRRDAGTQHIVFAIGPADGWSNQTLSQAKRRGGLLSLGSMTLAHQLARLVIAEQLYRACTILTGHPYHTGH